MTPFHVGMKVVCVTNLMFHRYREIWPNGWPTVPEVGEIYTVRDVFIASDTKELGLRLHEIRCGIADTGVESGFNAVYFRPIVKTDISIFEKMLVPAPKKKARTDA